jgi:hypothetical protein
MNEFELRRRLRDLQTERDPGRELWPGISARLDSGRARRPSRGWLPLALVAGAATLLAVLVALRPLPQPSVSAPALAAQGDLSVSLALLPRTAAGMNVEYRAALASLPPSALPEELQQTAQLLDDSALQLRNALRQQPQSLFLLEQLRRVYALRLQLGRPAQLA